MTYEVLIQEKNEIIIELESKLAQQKNKLDCAVNALEKLKSDYSFGNAQVYIDIDIALEEIGK